MEYSGAANHEFNWTHCEVAPFQLLPPHVPRETMNPLWLLAEWSTSCAKTHVCVGVRAFIPVVVLPQVENMASVANYNLAVIASDQFCCVCAFFGKRCWILSRYWVVVPFASPRCYNGASRRLRLHIRQDWAEKSVLDIFQVPSGSATEVIHTNICMPFALYYMLFLIRRLSRLDIISLIEASTLDNNVPQTVLASDLFMWRWINCIMNIRGSVCFPLNRYRISMQCPIGHFERFFALQLRYTQRWMKWIWKHVKFKPTNWEIWKTYMYGLWQVRPWLPLLHARFWAYSKHLRRNWVEWAAK